MLRVIKYPALWGCIHLCLPVFFLHGFKDSRTKMPGKMRWMPSLTDTVHGEWGWVHEHKAFRSHRKEVVPPSQDGSEPKGHWLKKPKACPLRSLSPRPHRSQSPQEVRLVRARMEKGRARTEKGKARERRVRWWGSWALRGTWWRKDIRSLREQTAPARGSPATKRKYNVKPKSNLFSQRC